MKITDAERERAIKALIPVAMKAARDDLDLHIMNGGRKSEKREGAPRRGGLDSKSEYTFDWLSFFFHQRINELARKEGLRSI